MQLIGLLLQLATTHNNTNNTNTNNTLENISRPISYGFIFKFNFLHPVYFLAYTRAHIST